MTVESFTLTRRVPYAGGEKFGDVGTYDQIEGELRYAVDPEDPANARIVDLALAPRAADGLVRFRGAVFLLVPADPARGNGALLVDVPNRGRRLGLGAFNLQSPAKAQTEPTHPGDGLLFRRGFALASVGWQFDVDPALGLWLDVPHALQDSRRIRGEVVCQLRPDRATTTVHIGQLGAAPYAPAELDQPGARLYVTDERTRQHRLLPRGDWRFARQTKAGVVDSKAHVYLAAGFTAGQVYQLIFVAEGAPVVGCGLLAIRDAATWLRDSEFGAYRRVLGFGASQTGRFLRQFLYEGLNAAGPFDGLLVHIAGGQRGDFNHRFAQPSAAGAPSFGQLFPFATPVTRDPFSGREAGLLDRGRAAAGAGTPPKLMFTNTSWEYWRGDAALVHVDGEGADLALEKNVRVYHFAGTQHINGVFPPTNDMPLLPVRARYDFGVVDHSALVRAALLNLDAWVKDDVAPPPSRHPRVADGTARGRDEVLRDFPRLAGFVGVDPQVLSAIRALSLAADAGSADYPLTEGASYPALVSGIDADGNEIAGIRVPAVAVPVGTHTGWNPRHPDTGAPTQAAIFVGFTSFFAADAATQAATADPRVSIAERYEDRDAYLLKVTAVVDQLVADRYAIAEDRALLIAHCATHYDHATRRSA